MRVAVVQVQKQMLLALAVQVVVETVVTRQLLLQLLEQPTQVVAVVVLAAMTEPRMAVALLVVQESLLFVIQSEWQSTVSVEPSQQSAHTVFTHSLQLVHFRS
jgi:hypothetical protein